MSSYQFPYLSPHQSRRHVPTDWEMQLADAIESAFGRGAHELEALVEALNASRVRPRDGGRWTAETFTRLMRDLGA